MARNRVPSLHDTHLVPLTWDDEVMILKRELARAWASLKLEEHRNRALPPLVAADSPEAYAELAEQSAQSLMNFLARRGDTWKKFFAVSGALQFTVNKQFAETFTRLEHGDEVAFVPTSKDL